MYHYFSWSVDSDTNLVSFDAQYTDGDIIANDEPFSYPSCKY